MLFFLLVATIGPLLARHDPQKPDLAISLEGFSRAHLAGTDELGRDILTRLIFGARLTLVISVLSTATASLVGSLIGLLAGFYPGWLSRIAMRIMDGLIAFPLILTAILMVTMLDPGLFSLVLAIGLPSIPVFARVARSATLVVAELDFVNAARSLGASDSRLLFRHVLPAILPPLIVQGSLHMALAIAVIAGLSFLGIGLPPPLPEWGAMVASSSQYLRSDPHVVLAPGLTIMLVVIGFNLLGDGIRDLLDPRLRR